MFRFTNPALSRLYNLYEATGKVRTIAIVDYWTKILPSNLSMIGCLISYRTCLKMLHLTKKVECKSPPNSLGATSYKSILPSPRLDS